jgi:two-component system chemotaxis response regulator CheB
MNNPEALKAIVIGGSAGSIPVILQILNAIPSDFSIPIIIIIHRQRNVASEMTKVFAKAHADKKIIEPDDKDAISNCCIYLAPQNYHLLFERDGTFSLDYSEPVQYSRPSIDVTFESAAIAFEEQLIAILLSGANNDGTIGLQKVIMKGGVGIVQDPATADYSTMPVSAIENCRDVLVKKPEEIVAFLKELKNY